MKIAYVVLAHKNSDQLAMLLNQIKEDWCDIFLHIDIKSSITNEEILGKLKFNNLYFTPKRHSIIWGGYEMMDATFELLETVKATAEAKNEKYDRIILLSGQDFPIKSNSDIYEFFENNLNKEFISFNKIDRKTQFYRRINNISIHNWINSSNNFKKSIGRIIKNIPRPNLFNTEYYYGSQWFNMTFDFMEYLLSLKSKNSSLINYFKLSYNPDESILQTILMKSDFNDNAVNENLRYIEWEDNKANPNMLSEANFDKIINSGKLFARKFDTDYDSKIFEKLTEFINK